MDRIVVSNKRKRESKPGYIEIYVGRPSIYGNPIPLKNETDREKVLEEYIAWIGSLDNSHELIRAMADLVLRVRKGEKFDLICWCAPKRCHADVLKNLILGAV